MSELKQIAQILGINPNASLVEICVEIGRLQERANNPRIIRDWTSPLMPLVNDNPNKHYHNNMPCYNNPCIWS